jgi:hypothetical protein
VHEEIEGIETLVDDKHDEVDEVEHEVVDEQ